jgi:putative SOS response-associated peptidase YedK
MGRQETCSADIQPPMTSRSNDQTEVASVQREPDPNDLMKPYPSELMAIWPISMRVNSPANDCPEIREPVEP